MVLGWWLCDSIIFLTLGMVSVLDYFNNRFIPIPWILMGRLSDYWPYLELIYLFFSMWPSAVMCITMGYLFHVWGGMGVGLFCVVISICTELLCFGRGI